MLDRSAVRELVIANGLEAKTDEILAAVRPGWELVLDPDGDPSRSGCSKIGGDPDLASDEVWPVSATGARMVFLAQVDCSQLSPLPAHWPDPHPWTPDRPMLRVFADLLSTRGSPCAARVLLTDHPAAKLIRTRAPDIALPLAADAPYDGEELIDELGQLPECAVRLTPFLGVPEVLPGVVDAFSDYWGGSESADRYQEFANHLRAGGSSPIGSRHGSQIHHLLGEACSIQDDVRLTPALLADDHDAARQFEIDPDPALGTPAAWRVLLALHFDDRIGLDLGDGGALQTMVPVADLTAGRVDRCVCDFSSG